VVIVRIIVFFLSNDTPYLQHCVIVPLWLLRVSNPNPVISFDGPYEDYVQQIAQELINGKHNDLLLYRKRLRKPVDEYPRNVPPHVQATRKMNGPGQ
jgi:hypothetical protein